MKQWSGPVISTVDMYLTIAIVMMVLSVLVMPTKPTEEAQDKSICLMAVDVSWPATNNADVDLWVKGSGSPTSIGYSQKENAIGSLVKDDMGNINDASNRNSERTCLTSLSDGEYIINLVLFDLHTGSSPVLCHVVVSKVNPQTASMEILFEKDLPISEQKIDYTVIRFILEEGKIAPQSPNNIPITISQ